MQNQVIFLNGDAVRLSNKPTIVDEATFSQLQELVAGSKIFISFTKKVENTDEQLVYLETEDGTTIKNLGGDPLLLPASFLELNPEIWKMSRKT